MIKKTKDFYDKDVYQISNEGEFIPFAEDEIKSIYDYGAKVLFSMETGTDWYGKVMCETEELANKIANELVNPKLVLLQLRGSKRE